MSPIKTFRNILNSMGLAWWARVETTNPEITYWFGPFLTKKSLYGNLPLFLQDLNIEGFQEVDHMLVRTRKAEPLTI